MVFAPDCAVITVRHPSVSGLARRRRMGLATVATVRTESPMVVGRWLLIAAVITGLFAMHEVLAVPSPPHAHPAGEVSLIEPPEVSTAQVMALAASPVAGLSGTRTVISVVTSAGAGAPGCCPCGDCAMGHLCVAVLSGAALVWAGVALLALSVHAGALVRPRGGVVATGTARAPPTPPQRLSQLSVWRR